MAEGGIDRVKKPSPEDEEQRLRARLQRRKEDRHRKEERHRRELDRRRGPPSRGPPPPRYFPDRDRWMGPPRGGGRGPPPPGWRGHAPPPGHWRGRPPARREDRYGSSSSRGRSPRSYSRSRSRSSHSRSRSRSSSRSSRSSRSYSSDDSGSSRSRSRSRSPSSSESSHASQPEDPEAYALTKDQRTVFVSQLVMRADEREIRRYFRRTVGCKVNDVAMLRDKRTGRHKGIAYVELGRLEDVAKAIAYNNQAPDFQRFPVLIKASEAEKNYTVPSSSSALTAAMMGMKKAGPMVGADGKVIEAQKAYVGNLDQTVTQEQIFQLFSTFGTLEKVMLQTEPSGISKGFAFLSYRDPKDANLAIQTMSGQTLAGRQLKTGWANQTSTVSGVEVVTSYEFPDDAPARIQAAHLALAQMADAAIAVPPAQIATTAEAAINAALGLAAAPVVTTVPPQVPTPVVTTLAAPEDDPKVIGNADNPSKAILVRNMFNKDEETEPNWEEEIRLDFEEECSKYGKILKVLVMSNEEGGKIFATFESKEAAQSCASNLAGRWFDKRQLRVEFVSEDSVPTSN